MRTLSTGEACAVGAVYAAGMVGMATKASLLAKFLTGNVWKDAAVATVAVNGVGMATFGILKGASRVYDSIGALANMAIILTAMVNGRKDNQTLKSMCLVALGWVVRLGTFLTFRASRMGGDARLDKAAKTTPMALLWCIQALWGYLTLLPVLAVADKGGEEKEEGPIKASYGIAVAVVGLLIETVADAQKMSFKLQGKEGFISTGLWSRSRHPNYFGEILIWTGLAIASVPQLQNDPKRLVLSMLSPLSVYGLLRYVSGVPLLERAANKKFGDDPAYKAYKKATNLLVPKLL